ncbi:endonuclease V-like [Clavelina lepadiformis]|uniref:endonuclease V-like n=1 Tax=Clavelina lepadiformis TaxID=159417 RepID=UPI0040433CCC
MSEVASEELQDCWKKEQDELAMRVNTSYNEDIAVNRISLVGGLDISFVKDTDDACITLVVLCLPDLKVVYEDSQLIKMVAPYIPGYLAFREVGFFHQALQRLRVKHNEFFPQVMLVDGNGVLHFKRCGSASHLGVICDIPTIGVAKNLYQMPEEGIVRNDEHKQKVSQLNNKGDQFELKTNNQDVLGMAVLSTNQATNPVYVSVGHKCNLETAVEIVLKCSVARVPEPIRQADIRSRQFLRERFPPE